MRIFVGLCVGLLLFIFAVFFIFTSEGHHIHRMEVLENGLEKVVAVSANVSTQNHNGDLVHISGHATTTNEISDAEFGVFEKVLRLKRHVWMYQWQEKSHQTHENGVRKTVYTYSKIWSKRLIDTSDFHDPTGHENPSSMPYANTVFNAPDIKVGVFRLTEPFVKRIHYFHHLPLTDKNFNAMAPDVKSSFTLHDGRYFMGNPKDPQVGDIRVSYSAVFPMLLSIVGQKNDDMMTVYATKLGDISLVEEGVVGARQMFKDAENASFSDIVLRALISYVIIFISIMLMLRPLTAVLSIVPLLGTLVNTALMLTAAIAALVVTLVVLALAWVAYQPIIGLSLLALAAIVLLAGHKTLKHKVTKSAVSQTSHQ